MMAGNPNWWSMNSMQPPSQQPSNFSSPPPPSLFTPQYVTESSAVLALNSLGDNQDFPQSWSQLLLGGLPSEEDRFGGRSSHFQSKSSSENWEDKILNPSLRVPVADVKQEVGQRSQLFGHGDAEFQACSRSYNNWSQQVMPAVSSPKPCVASLCSNNILDFSNNNADGRNQHPNHSSHECNNSTATGVVSKKAKVQASSTQPPLKVRKEKLGDRITALHQIVSPFGKTDTASVLFEAIEYIRFLQGQIEALSSPYLGNVSGNKRHQHYVEGERNCIFPEEPGQLLNDNCLKRRAASKQDIEDAPKDLRNRGLCLVPVSCTNAVGSHDENGADYWAPAPGGFC
ncbi:transcription factor bHLH68-like [Cornus florida]|uniref:transcription factor bHLH68-like n=1 Tax=Cornus florida TaxID=4283 RepID=UPI00289EF9E8|nr:transcription factor bHLH68-like [Cornus florida]